MEVEDLYHKLMEAYDQSASGKGMERHGDRGSKLLDQVMGRTIRTYGRGFAWGQASKKILEAERFVQKGEYDRARKELLGAIVYVAAGALDVDRAQAAQDDPKEAAARQIRETFEALRAKEQEKKEREKLPFDPMAPQRWKPY